MGILDIIIIAVVGVCFIYGIFRGLIKEASSIIGVLAGFYAAYRYYALLSEQIAPWFTEANIASLVSFVVIFLVIFFLITFLGIMIRKALTVASMGWVDRVAGCIFGFVKGILLVAVLIIVLTAFLPRGNRILRESVLAPHVMQIAEALVELVPADLKTKFYEHLKSLKDYWKVMD